MNRDALQAAILLLDRAAAEISELQWIEPLVFLKEQTWMLARSDIPLDEDIAVALTEQCEQANRAAADGNPLPPELPRRIFFDLFDVVCSSLPGSAEALRDRCEHCANLLRAAREAQTVFGRAWHNYPEPVRKEEEVAFQAGVAELEHTLDQMLQACSNAIHADVVRLRARQARAAHRTLSELTLPPNSIYRETFQYSSLESEATIDFEKKIVHSRGYLAETDV